MTTQTSSQAIMAAVYHAFHRADPCHCHEEAKLSEGEVLAVFIKKGLLDVADTPHQHALSIDNLEAAGALSNVDGISFKGLGLTHLPELRYWTRHQIMRGFNIGKKRADEIERLGAKFGVLLADGNPALLEDCKQAGEISCKESWYRCPNPRTVPETPEEIRTACADDLFTLARQIIADGVSLTRIASNVATSKGARSPAGIIRRYLTRNQTAAAHVRTVTRQLIEMIEAEKPRRAKRKTEPDNVVRLASGVTS